MLAQRAGVLGQRAEAGPLRASVLEVEGVRPATVPMREKARQKWREWCAENLGASRDDADAMFARGGVEMGEPGALLIEEGPEGPKGRQLFFIVEGGVRVEVRGNKVAKLREGDFVGEASFVSNRKGPRSVTVICTGNAGTAYIQWPQATLRPFLETRPALQQALTSLWVKQLSDKLLGTMRTYERAYAPELDVEEELSYGADYGFRNFRLDAFNPQHQDDGDIVKSRPPTDPLGRAVPGSWLQLGEWNFAREYQAIRRAIRFDEFGKGRAAKPFGRYGGPEDSGLDVGAVLKKALLAPLALTDMALEKVGLYPVLRPPKAFMSNDTRVINLQSTLAGLTLSNEAIAEREHRRREVQDSIIAQAMSSGVEMAAKLKRASTPWFILGPYFLLCAVLDTVFDGRPLARFWFLETVARMPYFSYISMLHLYETLGWWTVGNDVRKVHFAQEWNEMHHLQIMEALGGDAQWFDRFFARHAAIVYYWLLCTFFLISPRLAYNFSELIESHAVDTYTQFVEENEDVLKTLPPPKIAIQYYVMGDLYMFDEFQTSRKAYTRRPVVRTLYDVFCNIRDDELEHVRTVNACQVSDEVIISPNAAAANAGWAEPSNEDDVRAVDTTIRVDWEGYETFSGGRDWDGPDADDYSEL